jgi:hypothetical protein
MKMAVESMEMAPGPILHPGRVLEWSCPQKLVFDGGSAVELYLGKHRLI